MTNYEEMMAAYQAVNELPQRDTLIASELQKVVNEELRNIDSDPLYSAEGKRIEREKVRDYYGKQFIEEAKKLRDEYNKAVVKAQVSAEVLLNESPPKPNPISIQSFEREFSALKMDVILSVDPSEAVRKIDEFASRQKDPYFAKQIANEFGGLASGILSSSGNNPALKPQLRSTFDSISSKAMTPEQKKAQEITGYMQSATGRNLFLPNSTQMTAIERAVGAKYAQYANKPHAFIVTE